MHRLLGIGIALMLGWMAIGAAPAWAADAQTAAAVVNGVAIRQNEVDLEIDLIRAESYRGNRPLSEERLNALRGPVIETLIERELLFQAARQKKIDVPGRSVDLTLKEWKLARGSVQQILNRLGMTETDLRTRVRKGLIVQRLLYLDVLRTVTLSEAEIQKEASLAMEGDAGPEQIHARHILIACAPCDDIQRQEALARIQEIQVKLQSGHPFPLMAFDYSDCPSSGRGGDLGYLAYDQMIPAFAETAFSLQPGQTSEIVETRLGYHLIQLIDRRPKFLPGQVLIRARTERMLLFRKETEAIHGYLKRLKSQATIVR